MYFHVKATRTNKGGEGIVSVNQTFYVMLDETLDSGVSQIWGFKHLKWRISFIGLQWLSSCYEKNDLYVLYKEFVTYGIVWVMQKRNMYLFEF